MGPEELSFEADAPMSEMPEKVSTTDMHGSFEADMDAASADWHDIPKEAAYPRFVVGSGLKDIRDNLLTVMEYPQNVIILGQNIQVTDPRDGEVIIGNGDDVVFRIMSDGIILRNEEVVEPSDITMLEINRALQNSIRTLTERFRG